MPREACSIAVVAAIFVIAALAPPANADHHDADIPWPSLLPPHPGVTTAVQPRPVPNCPRATVSCVDGLIRRLDEQWRALDRTCDHRALFARSYLLITQGLRADLAPPQPRLFRHREWFTYLITTFSNRYFRAFAGYGAGGAVPEPWRITFDAATRGDVTGAQDVLLASNAHTNHDLPFALAEMGLRAPDGSSHKHDHDAVNEVNSSVFDRLQDEFAQRFDPFFGTIDLKPLPLDELATTEVVKVWRESAWRNAERLLLARTPAERGRVERSIEASSTGWAELISAVEPPGYRERRDQYCST